MKILAFESSCDDTGAAIVEDGRKVISSFLSSQVKEHIAYGGVVPEIASRMHTEAISALTKVTLENAGLTLKDIDAIAVTYAPGLIGALLVGVNFAKSLAFANDIPLLGVHHLRSHVASNYISSPDLKPPFLALIVSGGHTHLCLVSDYTKYKIIARTRDDAAGEALDKAARKLGFDYPGGLNLDKHCTDGDASKFSFPRPKVDGSPLDFSFSGLKTNVINLIHSFEQRGEEIPVKDVGASFLNAVCDILVKNTLTAAREYDVDKIVLAGGVSANSVLRRKMTDAAKKSKKELFFPELKFCGDNAAMVASQAYYEFLAGNRADITLNAYATMSVEKG